MATPRRRSSRINGHETPCRNNAILSSNKLSSLIERDESPPSGARPNIGALVSPQVPPPSSSASHDHPQPVSSPLKTPQTASRLYPTLKEMHPSKVHQSTIKASPSRQDIDNVYTRLSASPAKPSIAVTTQQTPSKSKGPFPKHMTSPTFDFSFERPESDLSLEAQKIMDSVREGAAKIKAQMIEEKNKQDQKDGETDQLFGVGGRKINKAKGKSGRYSDVHRQEFRKMESITSHASTWKTKVQANASSLKRSPSKAGLDSQSEKTLVRSKSLKGFGFNDSRERLENTSSSKRVKQEYGDDTSAARPVSRDSHSEPDSARTVSGKLRPDSNLPSAATTPTKSSLARCASVKSMKNSMIPSLSKSATSQNLSSPTRPKTEGSNKYLSSLSRFGSMKSILHRPQPKFSDDPLKVAAGTHLPLAQQKLDLEKDLPSLPGSPSVGLQRSPTIKRVGFAPTTPRKNATTESSSPSKIPTPHAQSQPEISNSPPVSQDPVTYPILANSPNITTRTKLPKASTPGDFTFRSEKTMDFSPVKTTTLTSPGSTIRHVRPSGVPTHVPTFDDLPAIPHGMPNKKRSRPEPDSDVEDEENVDPMETEDDGDQPRTKKQRIGESPIKPMIAESPLKRRMVGASGSRIPKIGSAKQKGRLGMTLGRLNVLASPKKRS
ncbi:hypothetical protein P7C71_g4173, partial [Lecanoromycetidae sp. Uapishka_2]